MEQAAELLAYDAEEGGPDHGARPRRLGEPSGEQIDVPDVPAGGGWGGGPPVHPLDAPPHVPGHLPGGGVEGGESAQAAGHAHVRVGGQAVVPATLDVPGGRCRIQGDRRPVTGDRVTGIVNSRPTWQPGRRPPSPCRGTH